MGEETTPPIGSGPAATDGAGTRNTVKSERAITATSDLELFIGFPPGVTQVMRRFAIA
jgi:hypothetical protein